MKFLIVDDNSQDRMLVVRSLRKEFPDAEFVEVSLKGDFVEAVARGDFDVAITEDGLSWADGLWVFGTIKGRSPDVPVILVTKVEREEVAAAGMKAGLSDYVLKENLRRLPVAVRESLEKVQLRQGAHALRKTHDELELRVEERTFELSNAIELLKREIDERKRVEEGLRESEEHFRALIENSSDGIALVNADGDTFYASPALGRILGYTLEEVKGGIRLDLIHPDDHAVFLSRWAELLQEQERMVVGEYRIRHRDGSWRWLESIAHNLLANPSVGAVVCNFRDITERKRMEETLKQNVTRLNTLVGVARTLNSTLDMDALLNHLIYRLVEVISSADIAAIYLYDPQTQTLVPRTCLGLDYEALRQIRWQPGEAVSGKVFQTGRSVLLRTSEEIVAFRGKVHPENARLLSLTRGVSDMLSSVCVPLTTPTGEVVGTLTLASTHAAFTEDDSFLLEGVAAEAVIAIQNARLFEQVRVGQERLATLSRRLIEAQETERRFLARELHDEVGQSLTAIKLNLQAVRRLSSDPSLLPHIEEGIEIVERTLQQVRNLSVNLRPSLLDDLGLAAAARWYVDHQARRAGLAARLDVDPLETRLPPDLEVTCFRLLQEALTNVVRHARAREVRVALRRCEGEVRLSVQDDGAGFDVSAAQSNAAQGESFGLLGMRERAALVGGRVEFVSAPGQGTEVRARFPLRRQT